MNTQAAAHAVLPTLRPPRHPDTASPPPGGFTPVAGEEGGAEISLRA